MGDVFPPLDAHGVQVLARMAAVDFKRAYCHSFRGSLRLTRCDVTQDPRRMSTVQQAAYMVETWKRAPYLFPRAVARWMERVALNHPDRATVEAWFSWCSKTNQQAA